MNKIKEAIDSGILFLCVANSARSQIAEGLARKIFDPRVHIQSAGSKPAKVHPLAIKVMNEIGIDISSHWSKPVNEVDMSRVGLVISLCADEVCPFLGTSANRLHWFLPNPAIRRGNQEDIIPFRKTRDELTKRIESLHKEYLSKPIRKNTKKQVPVKANTAGFLSLFQGLAFLRGLIAH